MEKGRVAMAMSGGVDSSTAAAILREEGFDVVGFSMLLWDHRQDGPAAAESQSGRCCSTDDMHDAREVAARLGFPFYVADFREEFRRIVVRRFIEDYRAGMTPSPCVLCNSALKFHHLAELALNVGASHIATGHYARIGRRDADGRYLLLEARDKEKDQSYFLFELKQEQLARAMFPLGNLGKEEVRRIAGRHGLPVAGKPDSQEICFIPDNDYAAFIERHHETVAGEPWPRSFAGGPITDGAGRTLGLHSGIHHFTIGQRRGLGIAHTAPLYVLELRPEENVVIVGERSQLAKSRCRVTRPNWISVPELAAPLRVKAKIRSRHPAADASIEPLDCGDVLVVFDTPQAAICPGQACVFYQEETVVGGGWIARPAGQPDSGGMVS